MNAIRKTGLTFLVTTAVLGGGILALNHIRVTSPVARMLAEDHRNHSVDIRARYAYYVLGNTLVLDLRAAPDASPADLGRVVFQIAELFDDRDRSFDRVVLSARGTPVFLLDGDDFFEIGRQMAYGENPVYMIRKFPSKLIHPDGSPAFGAWTGGLLAVATQEMGDFTDAMVSWASGALP